MNPEELLKKGLKEMGLSCSNSKGQINAFLRFLAELKKWNNAYNLTAITKDEDIIVKHFFDSLLYLKAIPKNSFKIADLGTGAGFPGMPLKIIRPEMDMTLVESSGKKTAFLRHMIRVLRLTRINVLDQRAETPGREYEKSFDVVISRATFKIRDFLKIACPYVSANGRLVLSKGPKFSEELRALEKNPSAGGAVKKVMNFRLPLTDAERNLVIIGCGSKNI